MTYVAWAIDLHSAPHNLTDDENALVPSSCTVPLRACAEGARHANDGSSVVQTVHAGQNEVTNTRTWELARVRPTERALLKRLNPQRQVGVDRMDASAKLTQHFAVRRCDRPPSPYSLSDHRRIHHG